MYPGRPIEFHFFRRHFTSMSGLKWVWVNTTQVFFGENAVQEHIGKFVKPGSKLVVTFGGGSIDKNGARSDDQRELDALGCTTIWEGGIVPNPEVARLVEIAAVVRAENPDWVLSVGGGSVLDATKFIAAAARLPADADAWDTILVRKQMPATVFPIADVMTLPATGSEWNSGFVISKRATREKLASFNPKTYPIFSLLDPRYTVTLPVRQLRNGVYDSLIHAIDRFVTPEISPMFDDFYLAVVKELLDIGPQVVLPDSSLQLRERLIVAALFAINGIFSLTKASDRGIHIIGHMLTAKYEIDHAATLSMITPAFLENQLRHKVPIMAKSAEYLWGIKDGTPEEKARVFVDRIVQFGKDLGMPFKINQWEGIEIGQNDVEELVTMVFATTDGKPFGVGGCCTESDVREILTKSFA
jgi:alcohol dehydrogenase YqhD (iron-dependent ADH family)